ncbi:MAG: hypothetical protein RRC34_14495 [Lentisphaeria bacterium]|nr:hypothetical protein [Lentisphaeria bacterium]
MTSDGANILGRGVVSARTAADVRAVYDQLVRDGTVTPVKQFGRFSLETRRVFLATALALNDADLAGNLPPGTGIIHTSADGALADNLAYFNDYLRGGRKLARANLFIYTLPTSPLGEAAIHFNLNGPLYHITGSEVNNRELILTEACSLIDQGDAPLMLAVISAPAETTCLVTGGSDSLTQDNHTGGW